MSMIKVEDLTFSCPGNFDNIFEHTSFQVDTDWRLGFVGRNGSGKSDIYSRLQIEDLIQQFQPTMIFVEHDAAFRDKIATEIIEL
jgi:ATPase subunit of ABC transporter with duplicated ATPase domains